PFSNPTTLNGLNNSKYKIVHGPQDTAGLAVGLAAAECAIGLDSQAVIWSKRIIGTPSWKDADYVRIIDSPELIDKTGICNSVKRYLHHLRSAYKLLPDYDIIHITFAMSYMMLPGIGAFFNELKWLKRQGKKIAVTYQGCDVRLPGWANKFQYHPCQMCNFCRRPVLENIDNFEFIKKHRIAQFEKYADLIFFHNPDLRNYINRGEFRPYSKVNWREWIPIRKPARKKTVIGQAPSSRRIKGTRFILQAIENLSKRRDDFEFKLLENIPYKEMKAHYSEIDLFVDQLFLGWYGGTAVEAWAMEAAVMTYIREEDLAFVPKDLHNAMPVIRTDIRTLEQDIERLLDNPEQIRERGRAGRQFIIDFHDPLKIAKFMKERYDSLYEDV
ncbi:MAG: hypothetical protein K8S56_04025, partial [Candidatus Cloacimonetes bacterium]|nr:hypothetical protein [Candidatus Cloacimonadota bacterium]